MGSEKTLVIGMFGFGVVGEGLYKILKQTPSLKASIKKVCIKNTHKKRSAPADLFTSEKNDLLFDPEINVIVEVINDSQAGYEIVTTALKNGKDVVSASKKMLSEHLQELIELQNTTGKSLLYEASACASIPVIRNLEEYYDNDLLHSIKAIVNGSTNFILTKMFEEHLNFKEALLLAQQLGFAESDPTLDIEGYDAANKWVLLLAHSYGINTNIKEMLFNGITQINELDAKVAQAKNQSIKLVAQAQKLNNGKVASFLLPQFIDANEHLYFVKNEYNGVVIESGFADKQFFYGKGAGSFPTGSAVLSDIAALRYGYKYEYKKLNQPIKAELSWDFHLKVYVSFEDIKFIPKEDFNSIEEWHAGNERSYLIGTIPFKSLFQKNWWKSNNTSLILMPRCIVEDSQISELKKLSLSLAGLES
ncbi:MAG: homoserine dehydrogenase [Chitinophagaceae bacterium]